jgi:hypothetical protein
VIRKLIHSIFLIISLSSFAQKDSIPLQFEKNTIELKQFDTDKLKKYKKDKDFQYKEIVREKTWLEKLFEWLQNKMLSVLESIFGHQKAVGILYIIIRALPYIVGLIMLLLLIKIFVNVQTERLSSRSSNVRSHIKMSEDEEIIQSMDIKSLITNALKDENYRLAIRYHYLYILQQLELKKIIDWELQKTNHDYQREIKDKQLKNSFKDITYLYDFIWYGDFKIDANDFEKARKQFITMENKI